MFLWTRLPGMWGTEAYLYSYLMSTKTLEVIVG